MWFNLLTSSSLAASVCLAVVCRVGKNYPIAAMRTGKVFSLWTTGPARDGLPLNHNITLSA
jgi:hypothetical protein